MPLCAFSQATAERRLVLPHLRVETFFRNNEYKSPFGVGYTLPGYRIEAAVRFLPSLPQVSRVEIRLGATARSFFGFEPQPSASWYSELDGYWNTDDARRFFPSIQPIVLLELHFAPCFTLSMGHYDTRQNPHTLPDPLYNKEFLLSERPEQGVRFLAKSENYRGDFWIDWQRYTLPRDKKQELFTAGLATQASFAVREDFQLGLALYVTASHRGGEINQMQATDIVRTYFATIAGLELRYTTKPLWREEPLILDSEIYGAFSAIGQENAPKGWGGYARINASWGKLSLATDYWLGRHFASSLGGPFVNSLPRWRYGETLPRTSYWHFAPQWQIVSTPRLSLSLAADFWLHLSQNQQHKLSSAIALYLSVSPFWE